MSKLKLLALLLVVGNIDCMQQKSKPASSFFDGYSSQQKGAIAVLAGVTVVAAVWLGSKYFSEPKVDPKGGRPTVTPKGEQPTVTPKGEQPTVDPEKEKLAVCVKGALYCGDLSGRVFMGTK